MTQGRPENPHALPVGDVAALLGTDPASGLDAAEVHARRKAYGANELLRQKPKSALAILVHQFNSIIVWLLGAAAALSFAMDDIAEGAAILVVLMINGAIGFTTEVRAARSMEALIRMADLWQLTNSDAARLFGFNYRTWLRVKAHDWHGSLSQDQITRASLLLGVFKALEIVFSQSIARDWIKLPNAEDEFGGKRPLDVIFEGGIPAMMVVRQYVDALRGGN